MGILKLEKQICFNKLRLAQITGLPLLADN
jgi:hypothetical protein